MRTSGPPKLVPIGGLKALPQFQLLFAYSQDDINELAQDMICRGFDPSEPIIMGRFAREERVVHGYRQWSAALKAGLEEVWVQVIELDNIQQGVAFALGRFRFRQKAREGDILFFLCVRAKLLSKHDDRQASGNKEGNESESQINNVITPNELITHGNIASLLGVDESMVDHINSKYFCHLPSDIIDGIRNNKIDPYRLIKDWDPSLYESPKLDKESAMTNDLTAKKSWIFDLPLPMPRAGNSNSEGHDLDIGIDT
jgi:hypothetical protein